MDKIGKAKGMFQLAWERGFIDPSKKYSDYTSTESKKKDALGAKVLRDPATHLPSIIALWPDFVNETSQIQKMIEQIGASVVFTPKCHAELAGQGVENCWGISKSRFRAINGREVDEKVSDKQARFMKNVMECLTITPDVGVLRYSRALKCARRARAYKVAYVKLDEEKRAGGTSDHCEYSEIEKKVSHMISHTYKSHIDPTRNDGKFIQSIIDGD